MKRKKKQPIKGGLSFASVKTTGEGFCKMHCVKKIPAT
jgi:hypothetical protein